MYVCTHIYVLMHTNGCGGTVFQDRADMGAPAMLRLLDSWVSRGEMLRSLALLRSTICVGSFQTGKWSPVIRTITVSLSANQNGKPQGSCLLNVRLLGVRTSQSQLLTRTCFSVSSPALCFSSPFPLHAPSPEGSLAPGYQFSHRTAFQ